MEDDEKAVIDRRTWEEHCAGEEIEESEFLVEDFQLDASTGQVLHQGQPVVFASAELRELEQTFSRRGDSWSNFSPEDKLACFDMVDWVTSCPDDPPSRSLMFEPKEDPWSTWA